MKDIPELTSRPSNAAGIATFWALMIIAVAIGYTAKGCGQKGYIPEIKLPFEFVVYGISEQDGITGYSPGCMIGSATFVSGQIYESPNRYEQGDTIRICGYLYGDDEKATK